MHNTFFISDLHFGHAKILEFSPNRYGSCIEEHDEWLVESWNEVVGKKDTVWVLGDVSMGNAGMKHVGRLNGFKKLIKGNHDNQALRNYTKYFSQIHGIVKYKQAWLSHCPIHPDEIRKQKFNIHGHVHNNSINDLRYINVCVEALNGTPISYEEIEKRYEFKKGTSK